jgi:hypothetical protein
VSIEKRTCQNCGEPYWLKLVNDPLYSRRWCPFCFPRMKGKTPDQMKAHTARVNKYRTQERYPDPARADDKVEIAAHGGKFRSGYRHITGTAPKCRPRDLTAAAIFAHKIERALDEGTSGEGEGGFGLSKTERNRLKRMLDQWSRRARGEDARFNVVGNRGGRLDYYDETKVVWEKKMIRIKRSDHGGYSD